MKFPVASAGVAMMTGHQVLQLVLDGWKKASQGADIQCQGLERLGSGMVQMVEGLE